MYKSFFLSDHNMVYNVKAGIAAASSLAGTAMAYKNYETNSGNTGAKPLTKNGNSSWQKSSYTK
jgi:hypothetical protein